MAELEPIRVPLSPRYALVIDDAIKHGRRGVHLSLEAMNAAGRTVGRIPGGITIGLERVGAVIKAIRAVAVAAKTERAKRHAVDGAW